MNNKIAFTAIQMNWCTHCSRSWCGIISFSCLSLLPNNNHFRTRTPRHCESSEMELHIVGIHTPRKHSAHMLYSIIAGCRCTNARTIHNIARIGGAISKTSNSRREWSARVQFLLLLLASGTPQNGMRQANVNPIKNVVRNARWWWWPR